MKAAFLGLTQPIMLFMALLSSGATDLIPLDTREGRGLIAGYIF
jgi:hypothetical protein